MSSILSISASALRIALVTTLFVGPVYAMSVMKDDNKASLAGAGLVLVVNLQRA